MVSNTNQEARNVADEFARWVTFQYHDFKEFQILFGGSEKRNELLEKTAIDFFEDIFWMYIERIILNVSRLTDPPQMGKNKNFSIRYVHAYFKSCPDYCAKDAETLVNNIEAKAERVRTWRKKLVAHYDLHVAIGGTNVKDKIVPSDFEELYDNLRRYVELLFSSVFNDVNPIDMVTFHGVDELIGALKEAHALRGLRKSDINAYANLMLNSEFRDA